MRPSSRYNSSILGVLLWSALVLPAAAEKLVVADGISVTRTSYAVPGNEQPFSGFLPKTPAQAEANKNFFEFVDRVSPNRPVAAEHAAARGWQAIEARDFGLAAKRFNQATCSIHSSPRSTTASRSS